MDMVKGRLTVVVCMDTVLFHFIEKSIKMFVCLFL